MAKTSKLLQDLTNILSIAGLMLELEQADFFGLGHCAQISSRFLKKVDKPFCSEGSIFSSDLGFFQLYLNQMCKIRWPDSQRGLPACAILAIATVYNSKFTEHHDTTNSG